MSKAIVLTTALKFRQETSTNLRLGSGKKIKTQLHKTIRRTVTHKLNQLRRFTHV